MAFIKFLSSATHIADFLKKHPDQKNEPQTVLVGRSNVGKSSLINHFFPIKNIAKTSGTPGKTSLLQCFSTKLGLWIDLPGYGFAKTSKKERFSWKKSAESVLENNPRLHCILFLLDSRHPPSPLDLLFHDWLKKTDSPYIILLTKADKLSLPQQNAQKQKIAQILKEDPASMILYSIRDIAGKTQLLYRLKNGTFT